VSESGKSTDAKNGGHHQRSGGLIGAGLGGEVGHMGEGAAIGAGAGAGRRGHDGFAHPWTGGLPPRGSTIEMVLDRPISFTSDEFGAAH